MTKSLVLSPEQDDIAGSEESDDYSEPDQTSELNGTSEAVTTPDVPIAEDSEEGHNDSQQVILSRNSLKYKSSHLEDQIIGNKESPRETHLTCSVYACVQGFNQILEKLT